MWLHCLDQREDSEEELAEKGWAHTNKTNVGIYVVHR